jgi:hypothetical protein
VGPGTSTPLSSPQSRPRFYFTSPLEMRYDRDKVASEAKLYEINVTARS